MSSTGGGGGKRSRPSGPKTHIPSDFSKRPKAKVGKRARKPANVTDTKFRAASVKVKAQDAIGRAGSGAPGSGDASSDVAASLTSLELESSRGKSLSLLLSTLNHHSSVVRLSSLGGLKDAIAPNRASAAAIRANLNAIVPALGRSCCVDDDDEVRKTALDLFAEIASRVGEGDDANLDSGSGDETAKRSEVASRHLSPYLPLLVAYVTSALNSLDVSIRLDGARAVETLIKVMGMSEVGRPQYVKDMLPAYVRVMVDAKSKGTEDSRPTSGTVSAAAAAKSSDKKKKNKKGSKEKAKESAQNAKSAAVLRSLVLLLKAAAAAAADSSTSTDSNGSEWEMKADDGNLADLRPSLSRADLIFVRGGTASNALLAHRTGTAVNPNASLSSLATLSSQSDYQQVGGGDAGTVTPSAIMSIEVQVELFDRLRDRLVELSQAGHFVGRGRGASGDESNGLCLAHSYLEEMHALISTVRLIWSMYSRSLVAAYTPVPGKRKSAEDASPKKLRSVTGAIHSQFISMLPLMSGDGGGRSDGNQDSSRYDAANAILCSAVGELGCVLERTTTTKSQKASDSNLSSTGDVASSVWTNTVFAYVLPRLDNREEIVDVTILKVVGQLMFGPYLDSEPRRRKELIEKFGEAFFPSNGNVDQNTCISASGRLASMLLVDLMVKTLPMPTSISEDAVNSDVYQTQLLVGSMAQVLPTYLLHWEDQFPHQSATVLATLMGIARQHPSGSPLNVEGTVIEVFEDSGNSADTPEGDKDPIALLVKSLRSSIGMLFEQPKKNKKKDEKTPSTPSSRQQSIFECLPDEIQRIILGLFGLLQYPKDSNVTALAKICARSSIDDAMKDYIMDVMYSIRRTLPMQLFLTFLVNSSGLSSIKKAKKKKEGFTEGDGAKLQPTDIFAYDLAIERLCRAIVRCGGSTILSMLAPLLSSWLGNPKGTDSSPQIAIEVQRRAVFAILACMSYDGTAKFDEKLKNAVVETSVVLLDRNVGDKDDQERLLAPVVALMMNQPTILSLTLERLVASVPESSEDDLQGLIRCLFHIVKNSALGSTLKEQGHADRLEQLGQVIEKKVANGPLDRVGGSLSTEIQIHIGRKVGGV